MKRCLYCLDELSDPTSDYHAVCSQSFFGSAEPPKLEYSFSEMEALAKTVVSNHIAVTGVQPKLSLSISEIRCTRTRCLTLLIVGI
jgi:serine/threonine-protein kinase HipA